MTATGPKECPKANVLNAMPKSVQPKAEANAAFDFFVEFYGGKYDRAVKCLTKDRADRLAVHDFPAEHWKHIRTTSTIATEPTRPKAA